MMRSCWRWGTVGALLLGCVAGAAGAPTVASYLRNVDRLIEAHRRGSTRLAVPAERTGRALMAGGSLYLMGGHPGWVGEGVYRSGGLAAARPLRSVVRPRAGDVVWMNFSARTYQAVLSDAATLEKKGCLVAAFGPRPSGRPAPFTLRVDSLTPWDADEDFTLMGNVLSLWTLTAELAASTASQGKSLVFVQSFLFPGGSQRHERYKDLTFHDGAPAMTPVAGGVLSRAYLDYVAKMFRAIRRGEGKKIAAVGREIARRAAEERPTTLMVVSHMMPGVLAGRQNWLRVFSGDASRLEAALGSDGYLVWLGYYSQIPSDVRQAVRRTGSRAVWIAVPEPEERAGFGQGGDVFVDQHWTPGDCAIQLPGYDIKALPPSGLAQLFVYELLLRAAGVRP